MQRTLVARRRAQLVDTTNVLTESNGHVVDSPARGQAEPTSSVVSSPFDRFLSLVKDKSGEREASPAASSRIAELEEELETQRSSQEAELAAVRTELSRAVESKQKYKSLSDKLRADLARAQSANTRHAALTAVQDELASALAQLNEATEQAQSLVERNERLRVASQALVADVAARDSLIATLRQESTQAAAAARDEAAAYQLEVDSLRALLRERDEQRAMDEQARCAELAAVRQQAADQRAADAVTAQAALEAVEQAHQEQLESMQQQVFFSVVLALKMHAAMEGRDANRIDAHALWEAAHAQSDEIAKPKFIKLTTLPSPFPVAPRFYDPASDAVQASPARAASPAQAAGNSSALGSASSFDDGSRVFAPLAPTVLPAPALGADFTGAKSPASPVRPSPAVSPGGPDRAADKTDALSPSPSMFVPSSSLSPYSASVSFAASPYASPSPYAQRVEMRPLGPPVFDSQPVFAGAMQTQPQQSFAAFEAQPQQSFAAFEAQPQQSFAAFEAQPQQSFAAFEAQPQQSYATFEPQPQQSYATYEAQQSYAPYEAQRFSMQYEAPHAARVAVSEQAILAAAAINPSGGRPVFYSAASAPPAPYALGRRGSVSFPGPMLMGMQPAPGFGWGAPPPARWR